VFIYIKPITLWLFSNHDAFSVISSTHTFQPLIFVRGDVVWA